MLETYLKKIKEKQIIFVIVSIAFILAIIASSISFYHGWILTYSDAESHLNLSKKVCCSLTPSFAQMGGIWLPFVTIITIPLVWNDFFWRSGLAGSIVSGIFFVISCVYIYKFAYLLTKKTLPSLITFLVFALNVNVLYLQSTPMTEIPLIAFFILSSYYFVKFLLYKKLTSIILASLFGFFATLTRYDGWFLVIIEAAIILMMQVKRRKPQFKSGNFILFSTLAFFGIFLWLMWNALILGDPLYFEHSQYSAKVQQLAWNQKGELPATHNIIQSIYSYGYIAYLNAGLITFVLSILGFFYFFFDKKLKEKKWIILVLLSPFIFNVFSQFMGQDVIFAPGLTPDTFEWKLFNVRYGLLMIPFVAVFFGYLVSQVEAIAQFILIALFVIQTSMMFQPSQIITLADSTQGLSAAKTPWSVENFINQHYTGGLVLLDDYSRIFSITRSTIPMNQLIYVGVRPYYEESLNNPSKFASWVIVQKDDAIDKAIIQRKPVHAELDRNFHEIYNKDTIAIYQRFTKLIYTQ